jgi:hypothetical protein
MRAAFILVGSELRAWEQAETLSDYLRKVAGLRYVSVCPGWNRDEASLKCAFVNHAVRAARQPFLLAYIGHGYKHACRSEYGWSYGMRDGENQLRLSYRTLGAWLGTYREGPTLVLNDCCYADALAEELRRATKPDSVGLISSSTAEGYGYGDMTQDVIDTWMEEKEYAPRTRPGTLHRYVVQEARSGPVLDRHFFPCPKKHAEMAREAAANEVPA